MVEQGVLKEGRKFIAELRRVVQGAEARRGPELAQERAGREFRRQKALEEWRSFALYRLPEWLDDVRRCAMQTASEGHRHVLVKLEFGDTLYAPGYIDDGFSALYDVLRDGLRMCGCELKSVRYYYKTEGRDARNYGYLDVEFSF